MILIIYITIHSLISETKNFYDNLANLKIPRDFSKLHLYIICSSRYVDIHDFKTFKNIILQYKYNFIEHIISQLDNILVYINSIIIYQYKKCNILEINREIETIENASLFIFGLN